MKKRYFVIFITVCMLFSMTFTANYSLAADNTIVYDWTLMGVQFLPNGAYDDEYYGDGVVNLRCNYRTWDTEKKYLWLISNYDKTHGPASLYLGDNYDMSKITSITFDYITNSSSITNNRVSFAADPEGKNIVATAKITTPTQGALANPQNLSMEIKDKTYKGPIYLYIEYTTKMFVANLKVTTSGDMDVSVPTATPIPPETPKPGPTTRPLFTPGPATSVPTQAPVTQQPATQAPVTSAPVTDIPGTSEPEVTLAPTATELTAIPTPEITSSPIVSISNSQRPHIVWLIAGCGIVVAIAVVSIIFIWKKK